MVKRADAPRKQFPRWQRGNAVFENGWIIVSDLTPYPLEPGEALEDMPFALAGVRSPAEAVAFAERYGLLREGWPLDILAKDKPLPPTLRERYIDWQREAGQLVAIMNLYVDLAAALNGDTAAEASLRDVIVDMNYPEVKSMAFLDAGVKDVIARSLNHGREGITLDVEAFGGYQGDIEDPEHRRIGYVARARTLIAVIYQQLTDLIIQQRTMRYCEDCGRVFLPKTGKQRFCNETCAARTRYHRKAQRERETAAPVDGANDAV